MSKLLFVASSAFGSNSKSRQIAEEFLRGWRASHPDVHVVERDLGAEPAPHVAGEQLAAVMTPVDQRSEGQRALARAADTLIGEVEAADTILITAPMYNFSIPSTLKAWIDHITIAGRTFRYTPQGPEGLLKNKKAFVVTAMGGIYSGDGAMKSLDFQEPYLRAILGFIGLTDITFIHAEGLKISPEAAAAGMERARAAVADFVRAAA
jgi:FMN-dependent NADH-azoreductase